MKKESMTFEQSVTRLEEIVRQMENGDVALEEALKLFEEGTGLVGRCSGLLDEAELSVAKLMKGADGAPVELPFDEDV